MTNFIIILSITIFIIYYRFLFYHNTLTKKKYIFKKIYFIAIL